MYESRRGERKLEVEERRVRRREGDQGEVRRTTKEHVAENETGWEIKVYNYLFRVKGLGTFEFFHVFFDTVRGLCLFRRRKDI